MASTKQQPTSLRDPLGAKHGDSCAKNAKRLYKQNTAPQKGQRFIVLHHRI